MRRRGAERVHLGALVKVQGGAWGVFLTVVNEVTAFEPPSRFTDEQRQGPLAKWVHTHRFEEIPGCGHCPQIEDPARFVAAIEAFLGG